MRKTRNTALLLVDFINLFDFPDAGKLAPRAIRAARATAKLKARAGAAGMLCVYANDNFGRWTSEFSALTAECLKRKGAPGAIARLLKPGAGDLSVLKPRHSAFYGTPLDFLLEERQVERLVITGLTADICVFATAQDAYVRKFSVWVPADCVAAMTPAYERSALVHMARTLKARTQAARTARRLA
jgi:nicotinamidase-related amidase